MIRQEKVKDYAQIYEVIQKAFEEVKLSDHKEHLLVDQLRLTDAYIPELALVYAEENEVIGHIFYSEAFIGEHPVLVLAPVCVLPEHQGKGIGTQLVEASLERSKWSGFSAVVVLGDPVFYRQFDFEQASDYKIQVPANIPLENYLVLPLYKGALTGIEGVVTYAAPFHV